MSARVKVRAVIWVQGKLVVHRSNRRGEEHTTLPGGWVGKRESVTDALIREVDEELGIDVQIGDLLFAAEIVNSSSRQDVELIFTAVPSEPLNTSELTLIDPLGPQAADVLPPILGELAKHRDASPAWPQDVPRWLGNVYQTGADS
jgi:ADP-ribose pyrophosphatase YjhB (NUDIX family)